MPEMRAGQQGFLEPWFWNIGMSFLQWCNFYLCVYTGYWGLFIYNDNGEMMNRCFRESGGLVFEWEYTVD